MSWYVRQQIEEIEQLTDLPDWTIQEVSGGVVNNVEISKNYTGDDLPDAVIEIIGEDGPYIVEVSLTAASPHELAPKQVGLVTFDDFEPAVKTAERIAKNIEIVEDWADTRKTPFEDLVETLN